MHDFEQLGMFYLGRPYDLKSGATQPEPLLYDAKDLTTHAVCVGMTGSGKTGLCLALLEEAAIDRVPAIAIDPKGDLGNLLLTFPELRPQDFRPWVDESEAARKGISPDDLAAKTADQWRSGLAQWDEAPERIARLRAAVDLAIYTPGSTAGLPLTVLRSFAAPPEAVRNDAEALRERIGAAVSGLLALLGVDADPIRSREHILLSQLLDDAWRNGRNVDLGGLVHAIQRPPFERVGVVDIETFFPATQRLDLSMRLNNLLASPGFAGWLEGEPLDVGRLLYTAEGKPRLSIISIAHLSDAERMFFVTILLGEVLTWIRTQPGTSSLRAILYMDEIFGFFPPTANPPSKTPMLTLLKQARAYGLGVVLATQNPVDLDYKGLSNTGTWFLGRLQTERDKARVLEGLEGASAAAGAKFNRGALEATLAALSNRVFLLNNVHENEPVVFQTRWCLSYLRGPLTRAQIQTLMAPYKAAHATAGTGPDQPSQPAAAASASAPAGSVASAASMIKAAATRDRPLVPPEAGECFMPRRGPAPDDQPLVYRPTLFGSARLHYVDAKAGVDTWQDVLRIVPLAEQAEDQVWDSATELEKDFADFETQPTAGAQFAPAPAEALRGKSYARWQKELAAHLYTKERLKLWTAPGLKEYSKVGESEAEFRIRVQQRAREERDEAVDELRKKFATKHEALEDKIRRAHQRIEREKSQFHGQAMQTVVSIGSSILRAVLGRKWLSQSNVRGATTAAGSASRTARQRGDIAAAEAQLESLTKKRAELDTQLAAEVAKLSTATDTAALTEYEVRPRKTDIAVQKVALAWVPTA
ncbi:MAG: ATP-binding protein [Pirellulales bacterium]